MFGRIMFKLYAFQYVLSIDSVFVRSSVNFGNLLNLPSLICSTCFYLSIYYEATRKTVHRTIGGKNTMEPLHDSLNEQENETHNEGISWILLEIVLIVSILFIARTVHLLHNVRKIRLMKDPRTISPLTNQLSKEKTTSKRPLKTLVVLGSGGHTTEMLHLIKNLNPDHYYPVVLIVATTDTTSLRRVQAYPHSLPVQNKDNLIEEEKNNNGGRIFRIPRSREVGQSYWSSILTTMYSFFFAFWLVGFKVRVDRVVETAQCNVVMK